MPDCCDRAMQLLRIPGLLADEHQAMRQMRMRAHHFLEGVQQSQMILARL